MMVTYITQEDVFEAEQKVITALKSLSQEEIEGIKLSIDFDEEGEEDFIGYLVDDSNSVFGIDWATAIVGDEYIKCFYRQLKREKFAEYYAKKNRWNFINSGNSTWQVKHRNLRKLVFERDGYKCVSCGTNKGLHLHHIKQRSKFPEFEFDLDNCVTLCKECHKKQHLDLRFMQ